MSWVTFRLRDQSNRCISFTCRPRDVSRRENEERAKGHGATWGVKEMRAVPRHVGSPPGYAGPEDEGGRGEVERRKEWVTWGGMSEAREGMRRGCRDRMIGDRRSRSIRIPSLSLPSHSTVLSPVTRSPPSSSHFVTWNGWSEAWATDVTRRRSEETKEVTWKGPRVVWSFSSFTYPPRFFPRPPFPSSSRFAYRSACLRREQWDTPLVTHVTHARTLIPRLLCSSSVPYGLFLLSLRPEERGTEGSEWRVGVMRSEPSERGYERNSQAKQVGGTEHGGPGNLARWHVDEESWHLSSLFVSVPSVLPSFTFFLTSSPRFVTRFTPLTRRKEKWRSGESVTQDRGDGGRRWAKDMRGGSQSPVYLRPLSPHLRSSGSWRNGGWGWTERDGARHDGASRVERAYGEIARRQNDDGTAETVGSLSLRSFPHSVRSFPVLFALLTGHSRTERNVTQWSGEKWSEWARKKRARGTGS